MTLDSPCREDILAWLRLTLVPGLLPAAQRKLLRRFHSPRQALEAPFEEIERVLEPHLAQALKMGADNRALERALSWLEQPGCHLVTLGDVHYPQRLLEISDPPCVLYVRGRTDLLNAPSLAIVGSRNATAVGIRDAEAFAQELSSAGLTIVSGLALGIDAAAHRGALEGRAATVAVMGTGADRIYPERNRALGERILREGTLVSEFPLGTHPAASHFPQRNRIISGLSLGVLVVEAALESGSLITAKVAADQGREVFALPGSIHSPVSRGCHWLIKQGAKLVERAQDVLEELSLAYDEPAGQGPSEPVSRTDALLEAMGFAPASIDQLAARTGTAASKISARLAQLELEGRVASISGGLFQQLAGR